MKWLVGSQNNEKVTIDFLMLWTRHCKCVNVIWFELMWFMLGKKLNVKHD